MAYQFHHSKLARIDREYSMTQAIAKVNEFMRESGVPPVRRSGTRLTLTLGTA